MVKRACATKKNKKSRRQRGGFLDWFFGKKTEPTNEQVPKPTNEQVPKSTNGQVPVQQTDENQNEMPGQVPVPGQAGGKRRRQKKTCKRRCKK